MRTKSLLTAAYLVASVPLGVCHAQMSPSQDPLRLEVAKYVEVERDQEASAAKALQAYRVETLKQNGNSRVTLLQEIARPTRFVVLERWNDEASYNAHIGSNADKEFNADMAAAEIAPANERIHMDFRVQGPDQAPAKALYVPTHLDVPRFTGPRRTQTQNALAALVGESRKEVGNVSFDVFREQRSDKRPNHFTVVEIWGNLAALDAHEKSGVSLRFRSAMAPLLGALYDERTYASFQ